MTDWIDTILAIGSMFDWTAPIIGMAKGFNNMHLHTRDYQQAVAAKMALDSRGVKCRIEGILISGYAIFTREKVRR